MGFGRVSENMRWPRAPPADLLLTDKTFLVLREDFEPIAGKSRIRKANLLRKSASENDCSIISSFDTWPPKMRKKRPKNSGGETTCDHSLVEEQRPATAVLEAPLILDPRFMDTLDMSLLSKESLSASLVRVSLDKSMPFVDNPRGKVSEAVDALASSNDKGAGDNDNENVSLQPSAGTNKSHLKSPSRPGRRQPNVVLTTTSRSLTNRRSASNDDRGSPEIKKLDDNNNKNKQQQQQPTQLSSLQSSRGTVSSNDLALFTSLSNARRRLIPPGEAALVACRSYGRSVQPERFHTHSPSPSEQSPVKEPLSFTSRSNVSIIPIRMSGKSTRKPTALRPADRISPQSPVRLTPRSTEQSSASLIPEWKSVSEKKESTLTSPKSSDEKTVAVVAAKRRPRSVTCYICGREFGSMSFPIHEPKCLEKWHRENKALPASQRRSVPEKPNCSIDSEEWNKAAWEQSQALLIPCSKCKRTFLPDRLGIHERNCRSTNKVFHRNL